METLESNLDPCKICGEDSTKGCHGVTNMLVYSEYYCDTCYNKRDFSEKGFEEYGTDS